MTNISAGKWIIDSNIILYFLDKDSSFHQETKTIFSLFISGKIVPVVAQQNILEVGNVLRKIYHWNTPAIKKLLKGIIYEFNIQVIFPLPKTHITWLDLISDDNLEAIDYFDYYLSATMLDNGFRRILTANIKDIYKIPGIKAVNPFK